MIGLTNIIFAWQLFFNTNTWQDLIAHKTPKVSGCGLVYELGNPLARINEDCAIVDMRNIYYSEPHYHPEAEIYYILQGSGILVIGKNENNITRGDVLFISPNTAHFMAHADDLIIGVVNTPPFNPHTYVPLYESNEDVNFCIKQFRHLTEQRDDYKNREENT